MKTMIAKREPKYRSCGKLRRFAMMASECGIKRVEQYSGELNSALSFGKIKKI